MNNNGEPVSGAAITVLESGQSTTSAGDGSFSLEAPAEAESISIEIQVGEFQDTFAVSATGESGNVISIEITINPILAELEITELTVRAKIVGLCDRYFENRRRIRQANPVPVGTECTARVTVRSGQTALAHIPIAVQHRKCQRGSPWITDALGATLSGPNLGVGQVAFIFTDDEDHCVYRIVSPFELSGFRPVVYEVDTFSKQRFDGQ